MFHTSEVKLDSMSRPRLVACFALFITIFVTAAIVGSTGPPRIKHEIFDTYNCFADPKNVFDRTRCDGVDLGTPAPAKINGTVSRASAAWRQVLNFKFRHAQFFYVYVAIGNRLMDTDDGVSFDLSVEANLTASVTGKAPVSLTRGDVHSKEIMCVKGQPQCTDFLLLKQNNLQYQKYTLSMRFRNPPRIHAIGNVEVGVYYQNPAFSVFELCFKYIFLFLNLLSLAGFLRNASFIATAEWSYEQKWILFLLFFLVAFNDPLFFLTFVMSSPVIPFVRRRSRDPYSDITHTLGRLFPLPALLFSGWRS
jgi:hypothetical protein